MTNTTAGKEEPGTDACTIENPAGLAEVRDLLRPRFESREHWIFIVDAPALAAIDRIATKYYGGAPVEDFAAIPAMVNGEPFAIVAARKRRMLAYQLGSLLRRMTRIRLTDRDLVARDLHIIAEPRRLDLGTRLAVALFDDPNEPRAGVEDILTLDGQLTMEE